MKNIKIKSKFLNPLINTLQPYTPGQQAFQRPTCKLNTNENPWGPSPRVKKAIIDYIQDDGDNLKLYPESNSDKLRKKLATKNKIKKENVYVGNGSDEVLALSFLTFFSGRGKLCFPDVTYSFYPSLAKLFEIPCEILETSKNFEINLGDISKKTSSVIFPNPNAITGLGLKKNYIEKYLTLHPNVFFIIDEAYVDFGAETCLPLINHYKNILIIQTFSKSRSLAGLRIGTCYGDPDLINALNATKNSFNSYPVDRIASVAAIASIDDQKWHIDHINKIILNRNYLTNQLKELGFKVLKSEGNFIFVNHKNVKAKELYDFLYENKIVVRYFSSKRIENWLRITIGTKSECDLVISNIKKKLSEI